MRKILILISLFALLLPAFGQEDEINSANGWALPTSGKLHVLVLFVELDFDSTFGKLDPCPKEGHISWPAGELPKWKDNIFDPNIGEERPRGYMTKYFHEASFGKFEVTGEYINQVITLKQSEVRNDAGKVVTKENYASNHFKKAVLKKVNEMKFLTNAGSKPEDFDLWSLTGQGLPKKNEPNGRIDKVMVIWRNIAVYGLTGNTGFANRGDFGKIHGLKTESYSMFGAGEWIPVDIIRHEFSHLLYGGNNFHNSNCGVGTRTFMTSVGGWSNMSGADRCSKTYNAWDRQRMGWYPPDSKFEIRALCESGEDVNGDLTYGNPHCNENGVYLLRDFSKTGDAIRITLPHLPDKLKKQYLWLENHQIQDGYEDHDKAMKDGLYAFIQVGKDQRKGNSTYSGPNNYTWPLVAAGRHDFVPNVEENSIDLRSDRQNPFTGYNYLCRIPVDKNGDGKIKTATHGDPIEALFPKELMKNGKPFPDEYFSFQHYPIYGTSGIGFTLNGNNRISISDNPPATPLLSFTTTGGKPREYDNRVIYLNGISIEILSKSEEGTMRIRIRWDDFEVSKDSRWCGTVRNTEKLILNEGKQITVDQGLSPQWPKLQNEDKENPLFAKSSLLELLPFSETRLRKGARIVIRKGSGLLIRKDAKLVLENKALVIVEEGAFLHIEEGADIDFETRNTSIIHLGEDGVPEKVELQFLEQLSPLPRIDLGSISKRKGRWLRRKIRSFQ